MIRSILMGMLLAAIAVAIGKQSGAASPEKTARQVDKLLGQDVLQGEQAAEICNDETFLRRVTLDVTGQLPTPGNVTAFSLDPAADKRAAVVGKLLASDEFGANWGRYWRDVIIFRRSDERGLLAAGPLERHLTSELNNNTPWDEVATGFITATGDVREDGSTGLIMAQLGRPEDTVAEISRIFLGIQIQCAQCHDHPTDRWSREQFHELAAFFPRVAVRPRTGDGQRTFAVVADDLPAFRRRQNAANRYRGTPEHYMPNLEDPEARGTKMQPVFFINNEKLEFGTKDVQRRQTLADWMTTAKNPWFAKAFVNRTWAELVGEGFYEPVDDIGPDREASAPKTVDYLAGEFAANGYDVKWLYATIIATDAYQRQSRGRRKFDEAAFTANCPQRLRADQLYNALTRALGIRETGRQPQGRYAAFAALASPRGRFAQLFSYDPSDPRDEIAGSIPQALALMNAPQINSLISASPYTPLGRLVRDVDDNEDVVVELYLRCLAREPSDVELSKCLTYVKSVGDRNEAFEDVLWALINSTEFLHRK